MRPRAIVLLPLLLLSAAPSVSPPQDATSERAADPGDKMICKKFVQTGSLVATYRTGKPKREWNRERDNIQEVNRAYSCRQRDSYAEPCR